MRMSNNNCLDIPNTNVFSEYSVLTHLIKMKKKKNALSIQISVQRKEVVKISSAYKKSHTPAHLVRVKDPEEPSCVLFSSLTAGLPLKYARHKN